ncbi:thiamine biosynthesis lipoprotein [Devosia sp. UYZn731]|uniref:FAD:protein FMN transferase n=1 Tax=Devosia sp. UYZn731 TaxID=3156345 RepID=UPI00339AFD46
MGTRYSAVFTASADLNLGLLDAVLQSAVDAVDRQMSNWQPASDLSRFNAAESGVWVAVAADLLEVVETGLEIGRRSGGAFDIGLGQLVDAWGFGPKRSTPDVDAIAVLAHLLQRPATDLLELDRRNARIRKHVPLQLDLCGIAKGFGVDQLARCLDAHGIANYLVSIDGELRAKGQRPDGAPWHIAIERPDRADRAAAATIALHDEAIATSGDYRHWHEHDWRLVSHTMDPRSGRPVKNGLASVSVLAPNAMAADAWATALLVAGEREGPALAQANGLDALFILRDGEDLLELPIGRFV